MSQFDTFQARVGRDQRATRLFVAATGFFNVGDIIGGANGSDFTGAELQRLLLSPLTRTSFTMASAIQTVSVIPATYGIVDVYYPSATTSVKLPAANRGATLLVRFGTGAVASQVSILPGSNAAGSVQSLIVGNSDLSMILASINGASGAFLELTCMTDNEWAVTRCSSWGAQYSGQRSS